jgi:F-type H+-transporting ATPase subunit alpha
VNVGLSVSRVGGAAQIKAMKQVAGSLRLDLAQYREMAAFAQFGSDLDPATQKMLSRGARLVEVLKQDQFVPQDVARQVVILFAATNGFVDEIDPSKVLRYESELHGFIEVAHPELYKLIREKKELTADVKAKLSSILDGFKSKFA